MIRISIPRFRCMPMTWRSREPDALPLTVMLMSGPANYAAESRRTLG